MREILGELRTAAATTVACGAIGVALLSACASAPTAPAPELVPDGHGDQVALMAPLRLTNPRLACGIAALRFMRGDELIAVLGPDDRIELAVPVGRHVVTVDDGRGRLDHTVDVPPEGATLSPGCMPGPYGSPGLHPLTLIGPDATCLVASARARAGGLLVELGVDERQTLYLPPATHVVRIFGDNESGRRSRDATVDLTVGGAELPLLQCAGTAVLP